MIGSLTIQQDQPLITIAQEAPPVITILQVLGDTVTIQGENIVINPFPIISYTVLSANQETNSQSFVNIPGLAVNLVAGATYEMEVELFCESMGLFSNGLYFAGAFSSTGLSGQEGAIGNTLGSAQTSTEYMSIGSSGWNGNVAWISLSSPSPQGYVKITTYILVGSNAGTLQMQFMSAGSWNVMVLADSFIKLTRIS